MILPNILAMIETAFWILGPKPSKIYKDLRKYFPSSGCMQGKPIALNIWVKVDNAKGTNSIRINR